MNRVFEAESDENLRDEEVRRDRESVLAAKVADQRRVVVFFQRVFLDADIVLVRMVVRRDEFVCESEEYAFVALEFAHLFHVGLLDFKVLRFIFAELLEQSEIAMRVDSRIQKDVLADLHLAFVGENVYLEFCMLNVLLVVLLLCSE